jgi:predicted PurR-regulated permease PerM
VIARGGEVVGVAAEKMLGLIIFLPWLILIPILGFFLLKDADSFRRSALAMLPRGRLRWRGDEFFEDINHTLAAYIRAQLTACFIIGAVCSIGFWLIGLPSPLVLGLMAGHIRIRAAGRAADGRDSGHHPRAAALRLCMAFVVLLFLGVLRIVHDYVVYPKIIGQGIHLHPLAGNPGDPGRC